MKPTQSPTEGERLYRRTEVVRVLKERHGIDRSPRTLAKEHSLGTGVPVAAYDGRRPLHNDAGIAAYARSRLSVTPPKARPVRSRTGATSTQHITP
jgi:hypothetical protein